MATRFTKFNRQQLFTLVDKKDFVQNEWLSAKDIYELDMEKYSQTQSHQLVGCWKHDFAEEVRIPGAPSYKYTLGIYVDGKYYYVNAPSYMNKDFDEIMRNKSLIAAINNGECNVIPYEFETRNEIYYGFMFE